MRAPIISSFLVVLAVAPLARPLAAQATAEPAGPRAGSWGGEVMFPDNRVSVLRFRGSGSGAFVLTLGGSIGRETREFSGGLGGPDDESETATSIAVGLGVRSYAGSGAFRPVRGAGLMAGYGNGSQDFSTVMAGAYAELGAHYFLNPHASLGVVGELRGYWRRSSYGGGQLEAEQQTVAVDLVIARVGGAVYF